MVKVSVIIPNYNHAKFLHERIDSILNQTFRDFEIIILDDSSNDGSQLIIETYRNNPKVSNIVFNEKNSGSTFIQWKKGLKLAKGDIIWIAESDDYASESFLEKLLVPFASYPDLILSYCQSNLVDDKSNFIQILDWADQLDSKRWLSNYIEDSKTEVARYLRYRNTIPNASAVLFKKPEPEIFDGLLELRFSGDWMFYKRLLSKKGKVSFLVEPLNYFRVHPGTTRSKATKQKEMARIKEYKVFVKTNPFNFFEKRYDWMIENWFDRRKFFKHTKLYFIPDLPLALIVRTYLLIFKRKIELIKERLGYNVRE